MTRASLCVIPALCAACGAPPEADAPITDSDPFVYTYEDDDDSDPTALPNDDEASVILFLWPPDKFEERTLVGIGGVFVETRRGFENLAQCIAFEDYCVTALPEIEDDYVLGEAFDDLLLDELLPRNVGPSVTLGEYIAPEFQAGALRVYFSPPSPRALPVPGEPLDLKFGPGDWGDVLIEGVVDVPTPLAISSPDVFAAQTFTTSSPVQFRWTPGGTGQVYLSVVGGEKRLYLLADDGEFDLDFTGMALLDGEEIVVSLSRWTTADVDVDGHEVAVHVQYDQKFYGIFKDLGGRTEVIPADTCSEAMTAPVVAPGSYWGSLQGFGDDLNPGNNGCTGFAAVGQDGLLPYVMAPWEYVTVTHNLPSNDASLYLLTDCQSENTCLEGADLGVVAIPEVVSYFNESDLELPLYIVLDSFGTSDDIFELDIVSQVFQTDLLVPTCIDAKAQGPAAAGLYIGDIGNNNNLLDPTAYCASAPGGEGLVQVVLQAGETLTATATVTGHDTVLYVLYNCSVVASCAVSADLGTSGAETVVYTNTTMGSEIVYLVVDAADATGQYVLDLAIN